MRVCISYTHPYSIKSLNHTLPFRKCKLYFGANMQVASTLWPDIKSQKISERRFKLNWTKCSPRSNPNPFKTSQDQRGPDKTAQDSPYYNIDDLLWHFSCDNRAIRHWIIVFVTFCRIQYNLVTKIYCASLRPTRNRHNQFHCHICDKIYVIPVSKHGPPAGGSIAIWLCGTHTHR